MEYDTVYMKLENLEHMLDLLESVMEDYLSIMGMAVHQLQDDINNVDL